jgi:hypothetical protein
MKPLIVFSDVTIDGFMAGPDNDLDFMVNDPKNALPSFDETRRSLKVFNRLRRERESSIWRRWSGAWDAAQTSTAPSCPFARARARGGSAWTWRSIGEWTFRR